MFNSFLTRCENFTPSEKSFFFYLDKKLLPTLENFIFVCRIVVEMKRWFNVPWYNIDKFPPWKVLKISINHCFPAKKISSIEKLWTAKINSTKIPCRLNWKVFQTQNSCTKLKIAIAESTKNFKKWYSYCIH